MKTVFMGFIIFCVAFAEPVSGSPQFAVEFQWRSENKNNEQLSFALEKLYLTLYNTKNLPVETYANEEGLQVGEILRKKNLFFGSFFPKSIAAMMCDLNPDHCSRDRISVAEKELDNLHMHVGGYEITDTKWRNKAKQVIVVPKIHFSKYPTLVRVTIEEGEHVEQLITQQDEDCTGDWGLSCAELLKRLNPDVYDEKSEKSTTKTVIIPVTGVKTTVVFTIDKSSELAFVKDIELAFFKKIGADIRAVNEPYQAQYDDIFADTWNEKLHNIQPVKMSIESLKSNLLIIGGISLQSVKTEPFFEEQHSLFSLIKYPYEKLYESQDRRRYQQPIVIGIFDSKLDAGHCEFSEDHLSIISAENYVSSRDRTNECGTLLKNPPPNAAFDHGTHIVGLISSRQNYKGIIGLNPFASIKYVQIDPNQLRSSVAYLEKVAEQIQEVVLNHQAKVINMSWEYPKQFGGLDQIENKIDYLKKSTLFVVAAGNKNDFYKSGGCPTYPACHTNMENVITVVGLNRDMNNPKLWTKGNEGSNSCLQFHIGAIAEGVLSTASGDYVGRMSGTSQAAPQVSAAASLLYSIFEENFPDLGVLSPVRVRNRLIYTADLFSSLYHRFQSGRLNVERALDVEHIYLVLRQEGGNKEYLGLSFSRFGKTGEIICRTNTSPQDVYISYKDLRRMFFDVNRQTYVIFMNSEPGNRNSSVKRIPDCDLQTLSHKGTLETADESIEFKFRQIQDYISPMFR